MTRLDAHRPPGNLSLRPLLHHISHLVLGAFLCIQLYFYAKPTLSVSNQKTLFLSQLKFQWRFCWWQKDRKGFFLVYLPNSLLAWKWHLMVDFKTWRPQDATSFSNSETGLWRFYFSNHLPYWGCWQNSLASSSRLVHNSFYFLYFLMIA